MIIRHVVARENVDASGRLVDPERVRHGVIVAGRIVDLSGEVDPCTHLNLDYPEHRLAGCVVAERLERGAAIVFAAGGLRFAYPRPDQFRHLGRVDMGARRTEWLTALAHRKAAR
ncbi:MAG TPA: hypothetical protein VKX96_10105 [Chloroflexota bacterium]|nr:hypothetical protein [Chloroflexota bacterium]